MKLPSPNLVCSDVIAEKILIGFFIRTAALISGCRLAFHCLQSEKHLILDKKILVVAAIQSDHVIRGSTV